MRRRQKICLGKHDFTTIRAWVCLVRHCFESRDVKLARFLFDHELQQPGMSAVPGHRPDAVFAFDAGPDRVRFGAWVETDCSTESPSFVSAKVQRFAELHATNTSIAGVAPSALLFLAPSVKRLVAIAKAAPALAPVFGAVFTDQSTTWSFTHGWYALPALLREPIEQTNLLHDLIQRNTANGPRGRGTTR